MRPALGGTCLGRHLNVDAPYAFVFFAGAALAVLVLPAMTAALSILWWGAVLIVVRSDLAAFTIPDGASVAIAALGTIHAFVRTDIARLAWRAGAEALLGGLVAFAVFWSIKIAYRCWRGHDGLGFGDVKLAGACAVWLSATDQIIALEIAAASAAFLVVLRGSRRQGPLIPFGAFLAPGAWLVFVAHSWFALPWRG